MVVAVKKLNNLLDSRELSGTFFDVKKKSSSLSNKTVNFNCAHGCTICAGQCQCCNSVGGNCNCSAC